MIEFIASSFPAHFRSLSATLQSKVACQVPQFVARVRTLDRTILKDSTNHMKNIPIYILALLLLSLIAIIGFIYSNLNEDPVLHIDQCKNDIERLCSHLNSEKAGTMSCLARHMNTLSPECKKTIDGSKKSHPCEADAKKYCSDIKPGGGRIKACLIQNASKLSSECRNFGAKNLGLMGN